MKQNSFLRKSATAASLYTLLAVQILSGCNHSTPSTSLPDVPQSVYVSGKVLEGTNYTPLAGAKVEFGDSTNFMYTGADGKFALPRGSGNGTTVYASKVGYEMAQQTDIFSPTANISLTLAVGQSVYVSGKVLEGSNYTPLAGARVEFGDSTNFMYTGADGKFGLPRGSGTGTSVYASKVGFDGAAKTDIYAATDVGNLTLNQHAWQTASYQLNGDATDESGNGHSGTMTGVTTAADRSGNAGQALHFSGASSNITVPNSKEFDFETLKDFSFSFWVKLDPNAPDGTIPVISHSSGTYPYSFSGYQVYVSVYSGQFGVGFMAHTDYDPYHQQAATDQIFSRNRLPIAGWHNVVVSVSRGGDVNFYLDGKADDFVENLLEVTGSVASNNPLTIGSTPDASFQGTLDDVRIYQGSLTQTDALLLMRGVK